MARKFPRFIYSDPKNVKSEGPFIVHTLQPRMIMKVEVRGIRSYSINMLETWNECTDNEVNIVLKDADAWLRQQLFVAEVKFNLADTF